MLGDGGLSTYQATVTLHSIDDAEYAEYISNLIKKLFKINPSMRPAKKAKAVNVVISRINVVSFLTRCGLPVGDKIRYGIDMPSWIAKNPRYRKACMRGLFDTDGSVFTHHYFSKGKEYRYKKLSFTSASPKLLASAHETLRLYGMRPRIGSNRDVRLDSINDVQTFFSIIGSSNSKHWKRYLN